MRVPARNAGGLEVSPRNNFSKLGAKNKFYNFKNSCFTVVYWLANLKIIHDKHMYSSKIEINVEG